MKFHKHYVISETDTLIAMLYAYNMPLEKINSLFVCHSILSKCDIFWDDNITTQVVYRMNQKLVTNVNK